MWGKQNYCNIISTGSKHLYLPGAHDGVWNVEALQCSEELIVCEALIDAMTFWVHGFRNVTASYGTQGFTEVHLQALLASNVKRVLIAYDRDEAGNTAAQLLADNLTENGIDAFRILLPKGQDVNEFALQTTPAHKSLGLVIRKAEFMGKGKAPERQQDIAIQLSEAIHDESAEGPVRQKVESPFGQSEAERDVIAPQAKGVTPSGLPLCEAKVVPLAPQTIEAEVTDREVTITFGDRIYKVRGLQKNMSYDQLKVTLLASRNDFVHIDTFDLYQSRPRQIFINQAAQELGCEADTIKKDLGKILAKLEELQDQNITQTLEPKEQTKTLNDQEYNDAMALLKDENLLTRILDEFNTAGVVGEETNKLVGYLSCVSRKLDKPLAVIIQSSSAAGKSSLMEAILNFIPEEERIQYSAMTGQSLFYMGETNLKHKILAIAEEEGAENASYALKLLQSEGELTIASTGKDDTSGNLITKEYRVEGPVMLFLTTTAIDIDEELMNRCVVLTVNESRDQTQAIHTAQRHQQTLDGLLKNEDRKHITQLHRNAQRLLRPLLVANPFAEQLTFINDKTRTRRDHMKYLTLIRTIALLHQYQREVKTVEHNGKPLQYIEVIPQDIEIANQLAHDVLGRTLDELPPQTRTLLKHIYQMVHDGCKKHGVDLAEYRFSRKDIRAFTGWSDGQLKIHCTRLTDLEYLLIHRGGRGQSMVYELLYDGTWDEQKRHLMGLIDASTLVYDCEKSGQKANKLVLSQPQVRPKSGGSQGAKKAETKDIATPFKDSAQNSPENAYRAIKNGESYRTSPSYCAGA